MDPFAYREGVLHADSVSLEAVAAEHGTPCYVYSARAVEAAWRAFDDAFDGLDHLVCYAVKANSSLAVLDRLARLGSGFDIVSAGELERVLAAGGEARRTVFSGVGKGAAELGRALEAGVRCFNVESAPELERLAELARSRGLRASISLRVNPDVDARTHPYIATGLRESKFGIPIDEAPDLYRHAAGLEGIEIAGIDFHIGSQLASLAPFEEALARVLGLADALAAEGIALGHVDVGGGVGIRYRDEEAPSPEAFARAVRRAVGGRRLGVLCEPGRAIAGPAGVLLTRVEYLKANGPHRFAVVDAAMNDLLRPALYGGWHAVEPVRARPSPGAVRGRFDVVGPVCESADFLARARDLELAPGDLLAVRAAGAYGFVMASNYNTRPRPPEILVDGERVHVARRRERLEDLLALESRPSW